MDRLLAAAGVVVAVAGLYVALVRPWHLTWGASPDEVYRSLPGDDLVPSPRLAATHAITIQAPPSAVWPWLVQIGQGRGGLYSYDWLENLFRLDIHSADRIIPELQRLEVGDVVPLAPGGFGPPVAILEPERALVLGGAFDPSAGRAATAAQAGAAEQGLSGKAHMAVSWAFYLFPAGGGSTRLVERFRAAWSPNPVTTLMMRVFLEPASFIMERKMLLGVRARAEKAWAGSP